MAGAIEFCDHSFVVAAATLDAAAIVVIAAEAPLSIILNVNVVAVLEATVVGSTYAYSQKNVRLAGTVNMSVVALVFRSIPVFIIPN